MPRKLFLVLILFSICISCSKDPLKLCKVDDFPIARIYENLNSTNDFNDDFWMDAKNYEIVFKVKEKMMLCVLGYQQAENSDGKVEIVIFEEEIQIHRQTSKFSEKDISYIKLPDLELDPDKTYKIKRTISEGRVVGRVLFPTDITIDPNPFNFPIENENFVLIETNFYDTLSPLATKITNTLLPFIDIGLIK